MFGAPDPNMTGPSKIFLGGLVAAGICLASGQVMVSRLSSELSSLVSSCRSEGHKIQESSPWAKDDLVCEPKELVWISNLKGIQLQIATTYGKLSNWKDGSRFGAILIILVAGIPVLWYFFLHRVRELSNAIFGRSR
jgi:hypothetical protein